MSITREALALYAAGRATDAIILLFNAIGEPDRMHPAAEERQLCMQLLSQLLEGVSLDSGNAVVHRVLLELLDNRSVDAQHIARAALGLIVASPEFAALERWSSSPDEQIDEAHVVPALQAFAYLPLVRALLPRVVLSSARAERVMTFARRALLALVSRATPAESWQWDAVLLLAQSAFNGEYAWHERDDEREFVDAAAAHLSAWLAQRRNAAHDASADAPAPMLLLFALYRRLTLLTHWEGLAIVPVAAWEPFGVWVTPTLVQHVDDRLEERRLAAAMASLSHPMSSGHDDASVRVRAMYETHPYPRWTALGMPRVSSVARFIHELSGRGAPPDALRILVAGCGTGRQAAHTARSFPDTRVVALDLSSASLGYAARMTRKLGIDTVDFMQGDILALDALHEQFVIVFCSGVLHHMHDPLAGWTQLVQRLHPQGIMKIALYSETARHPVAAARSVLDAHEFAGTDDDVRRCRELLLALPADHAARAVTDSTDFYSLSGCRDLVMHVQERTYTIRALAEALDALQLRFLGFQVPVNVQHAFAHEHPAPGDVRNLDAWARFEQRHPATFWGMYQFFVERR